MRQTDAAEVRLRKIMTAVPIAIPMDHAECNVGRLGVRKVNYAGMARTSRH